MRVEKQNKAGNQTVNGQRAVKRDIHELRATWVSATRPRSGHGKVPLRSSCGYPFSGPLLGPPSRAPFSTHALQSLQRLLLILARSTHRIVAELTFLPSAGFLSGGFLFIALFWQRRFSSRPYLPPGHTPGTLCNSSATLGEYNSKLRPPRLSRTPRRLLGFAAFFCTGIICISALRGARSHPHTAPQPPPPREARPLYSHPLPLPLAQTPEQPSAAHGLSRALI